MSITHNYLQVGGKKPTAAEIQKGELAINFVDQMIWTKDHTDTVVSVGGGAGGAGSFEDTIYQILLDNSSYSDAFYDTLSDDDSIASTNTTYSTTKNNLTGVVTNTATTTDLLAGSEFGANYWEFLVYYVNPEANITVEYSLNNADWIALPEDKRIILDSNGAGSASLYLRYTWTGTGTLESYGVLYNDSDVILGSNTKLFAKRTLTADILANTNMVIPSGGNYDPDGKSLMIYINRLRMFIDVDYEEIDYKTVKFLIPLYIDDTIIFEQQEGYVDISSDNTERLNLEHDALGYHVLTDTSTAIEYRLTIEDGNIVLVEQ